MLKPINKGHDEKTDMNDPAIIDGISNMLFDALEMFYGKMEEKDKFIFLMNIVTAMYMKITYQSLKKESRKLCLEVMVDQIMENYEDNDKRLEKL